MIELKRLKLINWHNFENVTFNCARLTYMIGVNAVGKTTILDAIRYCLTTNRNFNALGNKKSGRTLQGSVHAKQRGENAYRRPGRTVAYIGAEFWDSAKRTPFVIAVRVESEGPMQELHPGDQTWYISEDGITLEQLPFIDPRTGAPSAKEDFKPAEGRLSYTRSPSEARDRICRALGIGRASSPLGKKFNEVFQMGTSMDEIPNFREFLYQYILPQPELDLDALQGDRVELENLHAVLAEAQTRAAALEQIVEYGREAASRETDALVNRGAALLAAVGALRTGAGIVTLASVEPVVSAAAARLPECCPCPCEAGAEGCIAPESIPRIQRQKATVLLLGPGLGYTAQSAARAAETRTLVQTLLPGFAGSAVLDADGLNAAADLLQAGKSLHPKGELILTPHPGEMARLTGLSAAAIHADREGTALRFARAWNAVVVLKGAQTVIAAPDGRCRVNPTGNPGLSRGGSGDVLAGMTSALLACGLPAFEAAVCAVYLHGAAADRAAAVHGEAGMLPHDLFAALGTLFAENGR